MKRAIVLQAVLIVLVAVVGCTDDNARMAKLDRIDSLMLRLLLTVCVILMTLQVRTSVWK